MQREIIEQIYENPGAVWTRTEPPPELVQLIENGKIKPCKAIDIACGEGFYSIYLASRGFNVTGIDLSKKAIQYAKENAVSRRINARFVELDIDDLDQLNETFDFVLEWGLLHHRMPIEKVKQYIKRVAQVLNKNGKYLSMCFNEQSPEFEGVGVKCRTGIRGLKLYYFSQEELRKLFEPHFRILEAKLINIPGGKGPDHIGNYFFMEKL